MAIRAQPFFLTALHVDSTPIANATVTAQYITTPPIFYPDSGVEDLVNSDPFVIGTTDSTGHVTFSLFAPLDLLADTGYYRVTVGTAVYTTTTFAYVSSTPLNFATVVVTPGTGPTTVTMLAQAWEVNSVGWEQAFLTIGLEVDGIVDSTDAFVSSTDQTTFFADNSGLITVPLIPTSAFRGTVKPKWKAILPSGSTYLFSAPDIGGHIFAGAAIASGTSIVGPRGTPAATDWVIVTGNYTASSTNNSILADATGGNITVTLPSAATSDSPIAVEKKDGSTNTVTISPSGGALVDGAASKVISVRGMCIVLLSDGTNWYTWTTTGSILELTDGTTDLVDVKKVTLSSLILGGTPSAATLALVEATNSVKGISRPDGTTITASGGVLSVVGGGGGSSNFIWVYKASNYTITPADTGIIADATSGHTTITLPNAATSNQVYTIKKVDGGTGIVSVVAPFSQQVDGLDSYDLNLVNQSITVGSDGSNWYIL